MLELLQRVGKMGEGEIEGDNDMFTEDEYVVCIQNVGEKLVLIFIRAGILVCVVAVVVVGVKFFRERSFLVTEVVFRGEFWGGGRWYFRLGWKFCCSGVGSEVEDL